MSNVIYFFPWLFVKYIRYNKFISAVLKYNLFFIPNKLGHNIFFFFIITYYCIDVLNCLFILMTDNTYCVYNGYICIYYTHNISYMTTFHYLSDGIDCEDRHWKTSGRFSHLFMYSNYSGATLLYSETLHVFREEQ